MAIGDRKDGVCLQLTGQVSRQPKRCRSAMLDPKGRAFCYLSGSLLRDWLYFFLIFSLFVSKILIRDKISLLFFFNSQYNIKKNTVDVGTQCR